LATKSLRGSTTDVTCEVVRTESAVRALDGQITELLKSRGQAADPTLRVDYYLANLSLRRASPALTLVRKEGRLLAALFGGESRVWGIPMGVVVCGDQCGDSFLACADRDREGSLNAAVQCLLSRLRTHSVLLRDNQSGRIAVNSNVKMTARTVPVQRDLALPGSYEMFLRGLGYWSRRNVRRCRRRAERAGWSFHTEVGETDFEWAVRSLEKRQQFRKTAAQLRACLKLVSSARTSLRVGLKTADQQWVGLAGARIEGNRLYVDFQLNHDGYRNCSVSLVLRSLLIEYAIARGIDTMVFPNGCAGMLQRYCSVAACTYTLIEKNLIVLELAKSAGAWLFPDFYGTARLRQFREPPPSPVRTVPRVDAIAE
jgi:hypothetical protein